MNVAIMQPFYLFLRKHFHQIYRSDIYVFYDDVQFIRRGHHNRNRIKGNNGLIWLTVPVKKKGRYCQKIIDVEIDNSDNWQKRHWKSILSSYSKAPYFKNYYNFFEEVYSRQWTHLADLNVYLIKNIALFLGINNTVFFRSSELNIQNPNPTQRLIDICEKFKGTNYIIGTRAKDYMEDEKWDRSNVNLEYFEPVYPAYPQLGERFIENCSVIDLLFNCGPDAGEYIWGKWSKCL